MVVDPQCAGIPQNCIATHTIIALLNTGKHLGEVFNEIKYVFVFLYFHGGMRYF